MVLTLGKVRMGATTTWERWERFDACRNLARHARTALGQWAAVGESPPYFGVSALPVCRTDSGLARNQCVSNGGARGRHASGFVGPAVALVALLHAAGDHIKRELGELIEITSGRCSSVGVVYEPAVAPSKPMTHIVGHADAVVGKASDYSECGIVVNAEDAIDGRGASVARVNPGNGTQQCHQPIAHEPRASPRRWHDRLRCRCRYRNQ